MNIYLLETITQKLASSIIKEVDNANGEAIIVHIMSIGGDVLGGNAIASVLRNSTSHVTTNVIGIAASMAAVISQAGDKRLIAPDANFNIHNAASERVLGRGTKEEHLEVVELLKKLDFTMLKAFNKTGLTDTELETIMESDKLISAQEAVKLGFFDGYSEPIKAVAKLNKHINEMSVISELLNKADIAAIKLGLKTTDDEAKKKLVAALELEIKGLAEKQALEKKEKADTGAEILTSEMVSREEFELFKAEILALIEPLLGAVSELPTPEKTETIVEEKTEAKLNSLLTALKSKTTIPAGKQTFEQPAEEKEDWKEYDAKKKEIKEKTGR